MKDELTYAVWWGNEKGFLGLAMKNIFGWSVARNDSTPTHRLTEPDAVCLLWNMVNEE